MASQNDKLIAGRICSSDPACPKCGDLGRRDQERCEACNAFLYPQVPRA